MKNARVSMFANATSPTALECDLSLILDNIKNGAYANKIKALRELRKSDPKAYDLQKKNLPAFTVSGTAKSRKEPLSHSGLIQGDLDKLNGKLEEVRATLQNDPHVAFGFVSPSGDGFKFGIAVDPSDHTSAFLAAQEYFRKTYGYIIDPSVKDRLRLCFVSYDPALWTRPDAIPVPSLPKDAPKAKPAAFATPSGERPKLAEQVLGKITWKSDVYGFCQCPGQHLHTTPTGPDHCDVRLEGVPTIHCFHGSCANIVAGVNHQLRSVIAKAEYVPPDFRTTSKVPANHEYLGEDSFEAATPTPPKPSLPAIVDCADFLATKIVLPDELVHGVLHRGCKLVLGGGSKTFKTWTLLDLALSVGYAKRWLSFQTVQGRVLYLNFEIQEGFFQERIDFVAKAKEITIVPGRVDVWNLRGHATDYVTLIPQIIADTKDRNYSLIIVDPIYKLYGEVNENAAGEVGKLLNSLETLAVQSNAAVAFGAHYSKGNQATKESIDRISGSGVFARDPDSILNFTKHEQEGSFSVESTLRNHKPVDPFVVTWGFPLFFCNEDLDPGDLKQVSATKSKYYEPEDLLLPIIERSC